MVFALLPDACNRRIVGMLAEGVHDLMTLRAANRLAQRLFAGSDCKATRYVKARIMSNEAGRLCPWPRHGWNERTPRCSSPFCTRLTGLYMPGRQHRLPPPSCDTVSGPRKIIEELQYRNYSFVVCSASCWNTVQEIRRLRKCVNEHQHIVGVHYWRLTTGPASISSTSPALLTTSWESTSPEAEEVD